MKKWAAILLVAGCTRAMPPTASPRDAERGRVALAELQRGRALLVEKCSGSCHRVPMPTDHSASEWSGMLAEMAERAALHGDEQKLIERYLITMAAR